MSEIHHSDKKLCPQCGEIIKAVAIKCRYCKSDLILQLPSIPTNPSQPEKQIPLFKRVGISGNKNNRISPLYIVIPFVILAGYFAIKYLFTSGTGKVIGATTYPSSYIPKLKFCLVSKKTNKENCVDYKESDEPYRFELSSKTGDYFFYVQVNQEMGDLSFKKFYFTNNRTYDDLITKDEAGVLNIKDNYLIPLPEINWGLAGKSIYSK